MAEAEEQALGAFLSQAPERITMLAVPGLEHAVPPHFRPAAASVARQAAGKWTVRVVAGSGFSVACALRELAIGEEFGARCARVIDMILGSRNPELRAAVGMLADAPAAIMSAFFCYFMAHEFIHVEQGLGSDQYKDSDLYMPVVMEADHVADVAGLAIATHVSVPELAGLDERSTMLLLIATHIASMHSFTEPKVLDTYAFNRLLIWYLHFARFSKATVAPDLASPTMTRQWTVTLPRLLGRSENIITPEVIVERSATPYAASSDVVLAYHQEDGLYRIHRAALTDPKRITRLCQAILEADFDTVRAELEELLVNNPALVPGPGGDGSPTVEWAAGSAIEAIEALRPFVAGGIPASAAAIDRAVEDYNGFARITRSAGSPTPALLLLLAQGRETVEMLADALTQSSWATENPSPPTLRRRALSIIDQVVLEQASASRQS